MRYFYRINDFCGSSESVSMLFVRTTRAAARFPERAMRMASAEIKASAQGLDLAEQFHNHREHLVKQLHLKDARPASRSTSMAPDAKRARLINVAKYCFKLMLSQQMGHSQQRCTAQFSILLQTLSLSLKDRLLVPVPAKATA